MKIRLSELVDGEALEVCGEIGDVSLAFDLPYPEGWDPLTYQLSALRTGEECLVRGDIHTKLTRDCDRCLEALPLPVHINFAHSYDCKEILAIDLTADTREDILLSLPMAFRCQLDGNHCCPRTGQSYHEGSDPFVKIRNADAWQALDKLEEK